MIERLIAVAAALLLSGCYKPEIHDVKPFTPSPLGPPQGPLAGWMEDQPKMVRAEVKPSDNMSSNVEVEIAAVAPAMGTVPRLSMSGAGTASSGDRIFEATVPLGTGSPPVPPAGYPPMPYGTQWQATVSVPYSVLWQTERVSKSQVLTVGAALGCMSFDGARQGEGWRADLYKSDNFGTRVAALNPQWVATENARPSAEPGALSLTVATTPEASANEWFEARFNTGGLPAGWGNARGIRLAIKSNRSGLSIYTNVLVTKGTAAGTVNMADMEWVPIRGVWNSDPAWRTVEFPFPTFPPPNDPNVPTRMMWFTVNVERVRADTTITIDDVCPMR